MTRYLVYWKDRIFAKSYGFLSFPENMDKSIGKNTSKSLSGKYDPGMLAMRQKLLDHPKQSEEDSIKNVSKRFIQKNSRSNRWFDRLQNS